MDVFFALSHGVHRGILKRGKYDERADFVNRLVEMTPNVKFDLYGINNVQPIWADSFLKSISSSGRLCISSRALINAHLAS